MNNTLQNGFRILEFMADSGRKYSVKELSEVFELPKSHICRLLKTLVETGYLEQDKSRKYGVSVQILCLANACLSRLVIRNKARPYLYKLHRELGGRIYLAVNHHGRALIIDVIYTSYETDEETMLNIGKVNAVNTTASGKLCAAYANKNDLRELLDNNMLTAKTAKSVSGEEEFLREIKKIRKQGYSIADGEASEFTYAVAAPVFGASGTMIGAIGTFVNNPELSGEDRKRMLELVRDTAESVSFALGHLAENIELG